MSKKKSSCFLDLLLGVSLILIIIAIGIAVTAWFKPDLLMLLQ